MNVYRELGEGDRISNRVLEKKFLSFYEIFEEISIWFLRKLISLNNQRNELRTWSTLAVNSIRKWENVFEGSFHDLFPGIINWMDCWGGGGEEQGVEGGGSKVLGLEV